MKHISVMMVILCFIALLCCDTDPDAEQCARICADRYGECEHDCKVRFTVNSQEYLDCKEVCEGKYNTCIFDCY